MADVSIDRLSIDVPGLRPEHGERLARLVAEGLGAMSNRSDISLDQLRLDIQTSELGLERLARLIVDELRRQVG